jgi:threonine dehydrogenase-like Zn-dependent dehydrogenase
MRALVWDAPRVLVEKEQAMPVPAAGEVLIRVAYAGICGSELSGYLGHNALRTPPLIMGHEFSGEIVEMGAEASAQNARIAIGQAVTVNPLFTPDTSDWNRRGLDQLSPTRQLLGAHRPGAYAEYISVPAGTILPLPEGVSLRIGALTEPTACGVRIGIHAGDVADKSCLIVGAGPIGLLALQVLRINGAKHVFIADLDAERLAMGEALGGLPLNPRQTDVVQSVVSATNGGVAAAVDAVGTAATRAQCVAALQPAGTLVLSGLHEETSAMPVSAIIRKEIVARGSFAYTPADFAHALALLNEGKIRLDPWIVEAPLSEGAAWFERLLDAPGNVSKVLLTP